MEFWSQIRKNKIWLQKSRKAFFCSALQLFHLIMINFLSRYWSNSTQFKRSYHKKLETGECELNMFSLDSELESLISFKCFLWFTLHTVVIGRLLLLLSLFRRAVAHQKSSPSGYSTCTTAIAGLSYLYNCNSVCLHYLYNYYCGATLHVQVLLWGYITCTTALWFSLARN